MPVLSAKTQRSGFEALADKVEAKKKEERDKEIANEALKTFSIRSLDKENDTEASGVSEQNPTTDQFNISLKSSTTVDRQKQSQTEPTAAKDPSKNENEKKSERSSSIISGSQKIQELQEIQKQLNKSYEPKPLFEPRRPTLESIKSAIEKAKLDEMSRNKKVGTENDDVVTIVTTSDASTSVEKVRKKKLKKKKAPDVTSAGSAAPSTATNKSKKNVIQNKDKKKIEMEVKVKTKADTSNPNKTVGKSATVKNT